MRTLEAFLARPCGTWRYDAHRAAWDELVALVEALPVDAIPEIDEQLARAYESAGEDGVYFEDDQRIAPLAWLFPTPRPLLALAREVSVEVRSYDIDAAMVLAAARSPLTRAITRLSIFRGYLEPILPELVTTPLFEGLDVLALRSALIGGDDGAALLAATPALASVAVLDISGCNVHEQGIEAILASPHLRGLEWLTVDANCIDEHGERGQAYWDELIARLAARRIELDIV